MNFTDSPVIRTIDHTRMREIIRRATRREALEVNEWQASQLGGNAGNPVSAGLFRIEGNGRDGAEIIHWSVVLKAIQSPANVGWKNMGEADDPAHWNYWKRELFVYASDLLVTLPEGLTAPHCYGMEEFPGNTAWLWLEDIRDSMGGNWSLDRYRLTARHLGRLNGLYASAHPLPNFSWLGDNLARQWLVIDEQDWRSLPWDHPRVLQRYPRGNAFHRMLLESERFQSTLDRLPRTLCHGDTYPTNFMSRTLSEGGEQTVALDWALVNISPLGDDLGQFAFGVQNNLPEISRSIITSTLFESYLSGLRDSGCHVDPRLVRFGFTASAALRVGLFQLILLTMELKQGDASLNGTGKPFQEAECFEISMAQEAFVLLDELERSQ